MERKLGRRSSTAARTARRGSSSCTTGVLKAATRTSPAWVSTLPHGARAQPAGRRGSATARAHAPRGRVRSRARRVDNLGEKNRDRLTYRSHSSASGARRRSPPSARGCLSRQTSSGPRTRNRSKPTGSVATNVIIPPVDAAPRPPISGLLPVGCHLVTRAADPVQRSDRTPRSTNRKRGSDEPPRRTPARCRVHCGFLERNRVSSVSIVIALTALSM